MLPISDAVVVVPPVHQAGPGVLSFLVGWKYPQPESDMNDPSICCVVPSIRPERMEEFRKAWNHLFEKHDVKLTVIWDGDKPKMSVRGDLNAGYCENIFGNRDLFCHRTDAVRNYGFVHAAKSGFDYILTLDDDVHPPAGSDPIQEHLDVLQRKVPISWMNTAMDMPTVIDHRGYEVSSFPGDGPVPYLRGFPYGIRDEAQVMVSHGVWVNVPDFDGRTQLELTNNGQNPEQLPYSLPYFRGPVPKGCYFPFCGMNVMVRKEALPYLYFAPMGPDSGVKSQTCTHCGFPKHNNWQTNSDECCPDGVSHNYSSLNRFADIWCGILLKRACDANNWAIYTGASTVIHTRASDPFKNVEQERLGIEWNEFMYDFPLGYTCEDRLPSGMTDYCNDWFSRAARFRDLIRQLQGAKS